MRTFTLSLSALMFLSALSVGDVEAQQYRAPRYTYPVPVPPQYPTNYWYVAPSYPRSSPDTGRTDPSRYLEPAPDTGDLSKCLWGPRPPGFLPSQQVRMCNGFELNRRQNEWWRQGSEAYGSPWGPPGVFPSGIVPPAMVDALVLSARRPQAVQRFGEDKRALLLSIGPVVNGPDAASRAGELKQTVESFLIDRSLVQGEASIRPTFDGLVKLRGYLGELETAARRERETSDRILILTKEQKLPVSQRSPFGHPSVLADNLRANTEGHEAAVKERDVFIGMVRRMISELQIASAP